MIPLPSGTKIWLVAGITDMRNGFNGLAAKVQTALKDDPMSGHIFIFRGHSDSQVKLLWSTSDGLCILTIRLEGIDWRYPSAKTAHYRTGDTETLSAGKTGRPGAGNRPSAGATGQASSDELRPLFRKGIPPYHTNGNRSEPGAEKNAHLIGRVDN